MKNDPQLFDGRIPPHSDDLEEIILGSILLESGIIYTVKKYLVPDCFFKEECKIVYSSMLSMREKDYDIDLVTVIEYMRNEGTLDKIGGPYYLSQTTTRVGSSMHIETHCRMIFDMYLKRKILELCYDSIENVFLNIDPVTIRDNIMSKFEDLFSIGIYTKEYFSETVEKTIAGIFKIHELGFNPEIITTGTIFDEIFTLTSNSIIFIAALEKHGKTKLIIFLIHILFQKYKKDIACNWFSMEDDSDKIIKNRISIETGLDYEQLSGMRENFNLSNDHLLAIEEASLKFKDDNLSLVDVSSSIAEISLQFRNFCKRNSDKMNILVIDNFSIVVSKEIRTPKDTDNTVQARIANFIQLLSGECKRDGYRNIIIVLDHIKKELLDKELNSGYRPKLEMVSGDSRRRHILTQLVLLNQAGLHPTLVTEEEYRPPIKIAGHKYKRTDILKYLLVAERTSSRNSRSGTIIRMVADLGKMEYYPLKEAYKLINPINENPN
jgi:replicative DNA helicase